MKIAVGSLGSSLDAWVGGRFGYCPQFIIVDHETMEYVVIPMPPALSEQEASGRAIRLVARNGAEVLIVEKAMPECRQVMNSLGIEVVDGVQGLTVRQAVERYLNQRLATPEGRRGEPPKIAIAATGNDLDAAVGTEFGMVSRFVIADPATLGYQTLRVEPVAEGHQLRLATIRSLVEHGVNLVITPAISPACCQALWSLAIEVIMVEPGGTVRDMVDRYKQGTLGEPQVLWPGEEGE